MRLGFKEFEHVDGEFRVEMEAGLVKEQKELLKEKSKIEVTTLKVGIERLIIRQVVGCLNEKLSETNLRMALEYSDAYGEEDDDETIYLMISDKLEVKHIMNFYDMLSLY